MVDIINTHVYNLEESLVASGNAMRICPDIVDEESIEYSLKRCKKLAHLGGGTGHSNFRTGILVSFDLKYPQYFSKQIQRYHFLQYVSSTSMMHCVTQMNMHHCCNEYVTLEIKGILNEMIDNYNKNKDSWTPEERYEHYMEIISNCPMGLELWVHCTTNYEQLATIYKQRKNHKLKEDWGAFCRWIESLPYAKELIIC